MGACFHGLHDNCGYAVEQLDRPVEATGKATARCRFSISTNQWLHQAWPAMRVVHSCHNRISGPFMRVCDWRLVCVGSACGSAARKSGRILVEWDQTADQTTAAEDRELFREMAPEKTLRPRREDANKAPSFYQAEKQVLAESYDWYDMMGKVVWLGRALGSGKSRMQTVLISRISRLARPVAGRTTARSFFSLLSARSRRNAWAMSSDRYPGDVTVCGGSSDDIRPH